MCWGSTGETSHSIHEGSIKAFYLTIGRRPKSCCSGFIDMQPFTKLFEQVAFEVGTSISKNLVRKPEVTKELIYCCSCRFFCGLIW
jgi:hypothetical protein